MTGKKKNGVESTKTRSSLVILTRIFCGIAVGSSLVTLHDEPATALHNCRRKRENRAERGRGCASDEMNKGVFNGDLFFSLLHACPEEQDRFFYESALGSKTGHRMASVQNSSDTRKENYTQTQRRTSLNGALGEEGKQNESLSLVSPPFFENLPSPDFVDGENDLRSRILESREVSLLQAT